MEKIKVSVIIPVYNMEKHLLRCMNSVMNQTLKEIEIICINDGSKDSSLNILLECADIDNRIKIIDKQNTGYGDSMNIGIDHATGAYIGIVESDDFISPDMYEKLYDAAVRQSAEIVKANYYIYRTMPERSELFESLKDLEYNRIFEPMDEYRLFLSSPSIWSAIYDREFLNKHNIRFLPTKGASYQDTSFYFKTCFCAKRMYLLEDAFYYYWIDNENSSVNNPSKVFCICDELEEIYSFLLCYDKKHQWELAFRFKFHTYMWNYQRLAIPYQYAFLIRMAREFREDVSKGYINRLFWEDDERQLLEMLLSDHDIFFSKTSKYSLSDRVQADIPMNLNLTDIYIENLIRSFDNIIIYGAGVIGRRLAGYLHQNLRINKGKLKFAVSGDTGQQDEIDGIPLYRIDKLIGYKEDSIVIVAVNEALQSDLFQRVLKLGFKNYLRLQNDMLQRIKALALPDAKS